MTAENQEKSALIIGAGPAGLTAAWELLKQRPDTQVTILEATDRIGGISCTVRHNGNRIDIGGHRFFSKSDRVMDWWTQRMPVQGAPSKDDKILDRSKEWVQDGPDPDQTDRVLLLRQRISRIFYLRKFFDYPISMKARTFLNMGLLRTAQAGIGYLLSRVFKRPQEENLEDFLVNRFGTPLYRMFFEGYTEKVWGHHPRKISAEWGAQRIKGLSLSKAVFAALGKIFSRPRKDTDYKQKDTETSLIEQFLYPKYGPGQLWETVAAEIRDMGGNLLMEHTVEHITLDGDRITSITAKHGKESSQFSADSIYSTMPIKDLVQALGEQTPSQDIQDIAQGLPYRDFMTVGLLLDKMKIRNTTEIPSVNDIVPDSWIYIQEGDVKLCRLQIFNNWSPYMVEDIHKIWVGLEYMCGEEDEIWKMDDQTFIDLAIDEMIQIGLIDKDAVLDSVRIRIPKAYPAYFGTYERFDEVKKYLDSLSNLYCIGRNGQHRYNNQDHSMLSAMEAVECDLAGNSDRSSIWSINAEQEYHEEKQS
ncbi:MAG TPA: hypothetical protein DCM64_12615 [Gammaproteobacteria bacterium]|jgi:protoporphyrinogen oxidase|nr:hypothetical protein [Gammaproteobacteria bacterium]